MKTRFFHSPFSALAFSFLVIALGFISYVSTGHDDSHITFWASHTLLEQGEILNYNGDRIEQSSTLLFTLLIAATAFVTTINVIDSGYLLGIFFAGANIAMTLLVAQKAAINRPVALAIILASSPSYLFWSFSGMETTLTAFCILAFIYSWDTFRERKSAGFLNPVFPVLFTAALSTMALLSVRPEMPVVVLCMLISTVFLWAFRKNTALPKSFTSTYGLLVLCSLALLFLWRWLYFDALFPAPVYAKAGDNNLDKIGQGFSYLSISFLANPVFLVALAGALRLAFRLFKNDASFRIQETLLLFFITYLFFIVFSGGDWMLLGRFIAPLTPVACLLGFDFLQSVTKRSIVTNGILLLLLTSGVIIHVIVIKNASSGIPLWEAHKSIATQKNHLSIFERRNQEHLRDVFVIKTLDDIISLHKTHSNAPLNIASGQGGMVFFYTAVKHQKHVRFIDIHSLTDTTLIDCLPENAAGHGLHGLDININQIINILEKNPQCPVALPDIIYDLDNFTQHLPETLKKHGYTLWHNEKGLMLDKKSFSRKLYTPNVVLVKNELAKELIRNKLQPTTIRWNDLPYQKASGF